MNIVNAITKLFCRIVFEGVAVAAFEWDIDNLTAFMDMHGVDHKRWPADTKCKSLTDLLASLRSGEVWLESSGTNQPPFLHVNVAVITVMHSRNGRTLILREFRKNDNGLFEERKFNGSVGEKIRTKVETPKSAAYRGLAEELGQTAPAFKLSDGLDLKDLSANYGGCEVVRSTGSDFYPGFHDIYHRHHFSLAIEISSNYFVFTYSCREKGREVFFFWMPANM